ncbi:MAG: RNA methyltransferase [Nanoarchaeota archaeon]
MLTIVLFGPEHPGNVGAVARAMQNFGINSLVLIDPKCDHLSDEALHRAVHAKTVLKKAKVAQHKILHQFQVVIGTTSRLGTDYNIRRSPLLPSDLAKKLIKSIPRTKVALVFGRESTGLSNDEVALCDFLVTIPTSKKYPSLNLSHAVAIILYELTKHTAGKDTISPYIPISAREKELLFRLIDKTLDKQQFPTPDKRKTQKKVWRHIIGKGMLTKREAFALFGFFKKL